MKLLLPCILLLFIPFSLSAQTEPVLYKDFSEGIRDVSNSFQLNEHTNILQTDLDHDTFEMSAIDENMKVLWRTTVKGYAISCGNFKGKILAIAATDYSMFKGINGIYKGFLLDPKTGKVEMEKIIYEGNGQNWDAVSTFFTTDGTYFRMVVRQTAVTRALFTLDISKKVKDFYRTKDLSVIDFNEQLEVASTLKPSFSEGLFINATGNYEGDLYLALFSGGRTVVVYKYDAGKTVPSGKLTQDIALRYTDDDDEPDNHIKLFASESDRNVVYFSVMYKNIDKDMHLDVARLDFGKKTKQVVTEAFNKEKIKQIEKSFVRINKEIDKPSISYGGDVEVRYMTEQEGTLLVAMSSRYFQHGQQATWMVENSIVINGYDLDLKTKFQQVMPSYYNCGIRFLPAGFYADNNTLHVVANNKDGMVSYNTIYGALDLSTGKWKRMDILSKKKLKGTAFADGPDVLWYKKSFIVPFLEVGGFTGRKFDLSLLKSSF
ncbi:MAG: hypothetical protein EOP51_26945 [Sphingobacteriales bacterium]|nr:MAG: hypothetical protein EOP51_26945 [Sphingobacteriales bacterium]